MSTRHRRATAEGARSTIALLYRTPRCSLSTNASNSNYSVSDIKPSFTRLFVVHPELVEEWVTELNDADLRTISSASTIPAVWRCGNCGEMYSLSPQQRVQLRQASCPHCRGAAISAPQAAPPGAASVSGSFGELHPSLLPYWDVEKNGALSPYSVPSDSTLKVWWKVGKASDASSIDPEASVSDNVESFQRPVMVFVNDQSSPRQQQEAKAVLEESLLKSIYDAFGCANCSTAANSVSEEDVCPSKEIKEGLYADARARQQVLQKELEEYQLSASEPTQKPLGDDQARPHRLRAPPMSVLATEVGPESTSEYLFYQNARSVLPPRCGNSSGKCTKEEEKLFIEERGRELQLQLLQGAAIKYHRECFKEEVQRLLDLIPYPSVSSNPPYDALVASYLVSTTPLPPAARQPESALLHPDTWPSFFTRSWNPSSDSEEARFIAIREAAKSLVDGLSYPAKAAEVQQETETTTPSPSTVVGFPPTAELHVGKAPDAPSVSVTRSFVRAPFPLPPRNVKEDGPCVLEGKVVDETHLTESSTLTMKIDVPTEQVTRDIRSHQSTRAGEGTEMPLPLSASPTKTVRQEKEKPIYDTIPHRFSLRLPRAVRSGLERKSGQSKVDKRHVVNSGGRMPSDTPVLEAPRSPRKVARPKRKTEKTE